MATRPRRVKAVALTQPDFDKKPKKVGRASKKFSRVSGEIVMSNRFWLFFIFGAGALFLLSYLLRMR